ncbi:MAG: hypothetical protein AAF443_06875 [Chlamydiota bacterium]
MIWRGYFDRLFPWVLIRQVDKTQRKVGQKGPPNALRFLHFESSSVYFVLIMKLSHSTIFLNFLTFSVAFFTIAVLIAELETTPLKGFSIFQSFCSFWFFNFRMLSKKNARKFKKIQKIF